MKSITKRLIAWAVVVAAILMIPVVGMRVSEGWDWTAMDFVFASVLLYGAALAYELISRVGKTSYYRYAVAIASVTTVLLVWINGAVGIIGDGPINAAYLVIPVFLLVGAAIVRLRSAGMFRVLVMAAVVQMLIPLFALFVPGISFAPGFVFVIAINLVFAALWGWSARLFRRASVSGN